MLNQAANIPTRTLFILHEHIIHLDPTSIDTQWQKHSEAALDTITQMVLDIARSHRSIHGAEIDIISPVCVYVVRHTLQRLFEKRYADSKEFFQDSDALRYSLEKLNRRWPLNAMLSSAP